MVSLTLALWTQPMFSCQPGAPWQDVILQAAGFAASIGGTQAPDKQVQCASPAGSIINSLLFSRK